MKKTLLAFIGFMVLLGFVYVGNQSSKKVEGSVIVASEYNATTSPQRLSNGTGNGTAILVKSGFTTLGSVIVTGTNTGTINFYDATTSDVTKRTNNTPTTTILIASLLGNIATGTYTFDVNVNNGLLYEGVGTVPTSTVTFR